MVAEPRSHTVVSARSRTAIASDCWKQHARKVYWLDAEGQLESAPGGNSPLSQPPLQSAVRDALAEAYRWGDTCIFFLCPSVIAWVVPLCNADAKLGGILSGIVILDDADRTEIDLYLRSCGLDPDSAAGWVGDLPVWSEGRARQASMELYRDFYRRSGWVPAALNRRREAAAQQGQVAEAIQARKGATASGYPIEDERKLLAMIRVGDKRGARVAMNQLLAGLFLHAPALPVLRARSVELLGYLVRAAIEDNPLLEPLIEQNQFWIERLVAARDFDEICNALRDALDDFIERVAAQGFNRDNPAVQKAMDYVAKRFCEPITLAAVAEAAGLSTYRVAHLVKEVTGRSVMEHVRVLRVAKARELLEKSDLSGAEIADRVGYYDQSHFIKEFRATTGTTPRQYRDGAALRTGAAHRLPSALLDPR